MRSNDFVFIEELEHQIKKQLSEQEPAIQLSWWEKFNDLLGGLRPRELTVLSAPTGTGKTTLTANLVCQTQIEGRASYICSAEIGNTDFALAMYSAFIGKCYGDGTIVPPEEANGVVEQLAPIMRSARIVFSKNDDRIEPEKLIEELRIAHHNFGVELAVLDNLQFFMPLVDGKDALTVTDRAIRDFVRFVKTCPVHVVLIAHPRKTLDNRIQDETSVKGSSTIYQECSNFIGMNKIPQDQLGHGFSPLDREITFFKIRKRGWNVGKKVYFEFVNGRYFEKCVEWR